MKGDIMELDSSNHKDMRLARKLNRDKGWLATVSPETRQKIAEMVAQDALNPETEARDRTQSMRALLAADRLDLDREIAEVEQERGVNATGLHVTFEVVDADAEHQDQREGQ